MLRVARRASRRTTAVLGGALALAAPRVARADPLMANDLAMGGAHRANPYSLATLLDAPATLGLTERYDLGAGFRIGPDKQRALQVAALDSRTSRVSAGITWTRMAHENGLQTADLPGWVLPDTVIEEREVRHRVGAGVALPLLNRQLAFGVAGWYDHRATPDGEAGPGGNVTASVATKLAQDAVVLSVQSSNLLPWRLYYAPLDVSAGLRLQAKELAAVEANLVAPLGDTDHVLGFNLGAQVVAAEVVPLRVGFERDSETGTDRVTGGVGVEGDRGALDYGARFWVGEGRPDEGLASWHGISLRLFF